MCMYKSVILNWQRVIEDTLIYSALLEALFPTIHGCEANMNV